MHDYVVYKEDTIKSQQNLAAYIVQLRDDDFSGDVEKYDKELMNSERMVMLLNNAGIIPSFTEMDTDKCARLVITNNVTGNVIEKVDFKRSSTEYLDIFKINKVSE